MMRKNLLLAVAATFLVMLASCGSTSDIFGGNDNSSRTIHGTVDAVDLNNSSIMLMNTSGTNLSSGGGYGVNSVRVYFDRNTTVNYNGQSYRPENLDRGDQIDVRVRQSGNDLIADTVTVTYNANPNGTSNGGVYASNSYNGTVRYVDTTRRTIELDRGTGSNMVIDYDPNTVVMFNNRSYQPGDLEAGDQVTIYTRDIGGGRLVAQNIDVTRSMTSSSGSGSGVYNNNYATLRGTVRSIDTYSHTITMEQTSYVSGFLPNGGNRNSVITVQYDPNARVNVSGAMQPISGLERGDVIEIQAQDLGNANWMANSISLVRDVRR
ncbi:MAG TPA: LptA/OstA family protein [Thermoanaerobaculia bacterium]|nr:LptA/OstA family protein [Thermoanaerobaculia bacterium]